MEGGEAYLVWFLWGHDAGVGGDEEKAGEETKREAG